jgi:hypothetical protein
MTVSESQEAREFHVVMTFALQGGVNRIPILKAIKRHLENSAIARVHLLTETPIVPLVEAIPELQNPKVHAYFFDRRPSFWDVLAHCNWLAATAEVTVAVLNADVSFPAESDVHACDRVLDSARSMGHLAILALTRHDNVGGALVLQLREQSGLPNYLSADGWVFRPPIRLPDVGFFSMGQMDCDSMLAYELISSGHVILNPCLDITLEHHEENFKEHDYYVERRLTKADQDRFQWHFISRCILPYHSFGVPWNRAQWIESGYMPLPRDTQRAAIYLAFAGPLDYSQNEEMFYVVETIARINDLDLVVLVENLETIPSEFVRHVAAISRTVYFSPVENADAVIKRLVFGAQAYHPSVALIRRLDLLSPQLVNEFHSVVLDLRGVIRDVAVCAPLGHPDLRAYSEARLARAFNENSVSFPDQIDGDQICTLISAIFKTDSFIEGFRQNITSLEGYRQSIHAFLVSNLSELEQCTIWEWCKDSNNLIIGWFRTDPGLYECWNTGIRIAPTEYVSNANVDDLRHPLQLSSLLAVLRARPDIAVAASALVPFYEYTFEVAEIDCSEPWYKDEAGDFGMERLARLERDIDGKWKLVPHNLPHCMPIWRKSLHDLFGYFEESRFGTFADWAFWLKVTRDGGRGYLDSRPMSFYFINPTSHNRRGKSLEAMHARVESEFLDTFFFREQTKQMPCFPKKLNLTGLTQSFGEHRNAFNKLIESLLPLHRGYDGVTFIPFLERQFVWGADDGEAKSENPRPLQSDWIGILHVPFDAPEWFEKNVSPEVIFSTDLWRASLPFCRGIICLCEDLRRDFVHWYPDIPSFVVKFPTELETKQFNFSAYMERPRVVQSGDWLRNLQAIFEIPAPGHEKVMLMKEHTAEFLRREIEVLGDRRNDSVRIFNMVDAKEYDNLLSSSVVLCWLYATAANNIVTECIARRTPLLINPLPAVIEYLGVEYPLYMRSLSEASQLIGDSGRVKAAHDYLQGNSQLRDCLSYDNFFHSIATSDLYRNL